MQHTRLTEQEKQARTSCMESKAEMSKKKRANMNDPQETGNNNPWANESVRKERNNR